MRRSKKSVLKELRQIAKEMELRCHFSSQLAGGLFVDRNRILVGTKTNNLTELISCFFHEAGHAWCFKNRKYMAYHGSKYPRSRKEKADYRRVALRAELYADNIGCMLCRAYFPHIKYRFAYREEWQRFLLKALLLNL